MGCGHETTRVRNDGRLMCMWCGNHWDPENPDDQKNVFLEPLARYAKHAHTRPLESFPSEALIDMLDHQYEEERPLDPDIVFEIVNRFILAARL